MTAGLLAAAILGFQPAISRDSYGVPQIVASTPAEAWRLAGKAVAEDRLWQLEMSRRSALGQLSEVLGPNFVASDTSALQRAYTDAEYATMVKALPKPTQTALSEYATGVNEAISSMESSGKLPAGYAANGFTPRPWTVQDSCAVMVALTRKFGQGGAGELRNLALLRYLQTRPGIKGQVLDAMDDLAWQNDPRAITTVAAEDDPVKNPPKLWDFTRADSERQMAEMPNTSLLELAPAVRMAGQGDLVAAAQKLSVPYKVGSYAVVVGKSRSKTGQPLLLTAPQMGHTKPSVVHEMHISAPGLRVRGMDVPGVPGVIIGNTPDLAWGLTSGVADLEDVVVSKLVEDGSYLSGGAPQKLTEIKFTLKVKGSPDKEIVQRRTVHGPVLLLSRGSKAVYSLRSAFWMREVGSLSAMHSIYSAKTTRDIAALVGDMPVSFNFFYALKSGQTGYRYGGRVPIRAAGLDPRLPTPDERKYDWRGFLTAQQMPHVENPKSGLIVNWNNKPVSWWLNGDTPVWGRLFRTEVLLKSLPTGKVGEPDLVAAARAISLAETDDNASFVPAFKSAFEMQYADGMPPYAKMLAGFDGQDVAGSVAARLYAQSVAELRKEIFLPLFGNFTSEDLFATVIQPHLIHQALDGETNIDVLAGRKPREVLVKAYENAVAALTARFGADSSAWAYVPGTFPGVGDERVPYNNRGTYIQVSSVGSEIKSQNVVTPGVAESGPHSEDQVKLAKDWKFKPMAGFSGR